MLDVGGSPTCAKHGIALVTISDGCLRYLQCPRCQAEFVKAMDEACPKCGAVDRLCQAHAPWCAGTFAPVESDTPGNVANADDDSRALRPNASPESTL